MRLPDQPDDLKLLNAGVSHSSSPPYPIMLFEQAVFQGEIGQCLFQVAALTAQRLYFVAGRRTGSVTGKTLLARFEEIFDQL